MSAIENYGARTKASDADVLTRSPLSPDEIDAARYPIPSSLIRAWVTSIPRYEE